MGSGRRLDLSARSASSWVSCRATTDFAARWLSKKNEDVLASTLRQKGRGNQPCGEEDLIEESGERYSTNSFRQRCLRSIICYISLDWRRALANSNPTRFDALVFLYSRIPTGCAGTTNKAPQVSSRKWVVSRLIRG